jgi:polyisoprenoid-binding protein YceI
MKKIFVLLSVSALFLASCVSNPEGKKAETTDALEVAEVSGKELSLNTTDSKLRWEGHKVTGKHHGEVTITSGTLVVDPEGNLTGGDFVIDLNSIDVQDLEGEYKEKLTGHLKSDDFFDVENHPEAKFEITSVTAGESANHILISGNLTLRGVTKNITFDANVKEADANNFVAEADFNIEREDFGVSYKGKADDLISKEINIKVELIAKS